MNQSNEVMTMGRGVNMRLDVTLNTDNIAKLVVRKQLQVVKARKAETERKLAMARQDHREVVAELEEAAEELVANQKFAAKATNLAKALTAFTGAKHVVQHDKDTLDIGEKVVRYRLGVWKEEIWSNRVRSNGNHYSYSPAHAEDLEVKFGADMKAIVRRIEQAAKRIEEIDRELAEINLAIADAPEARERVSDMITEGLLTGEITEASTPSQILSVAEKARLRALPAPQDD